MRTRITGGLIFILCLEACKTSQSYSPSSSATLGPISISDDEAGLKIDTRDLAQFAQPDTDSKNPSKLQDAIRQARWDDVRTLAKDQLSKEPGQLQAYTWLAISNAALGDQAKAQLYAELVLREDSQNPYALNLLGILTWKRANLIEDYRQSLAYFNLAAQNDGNLFAPRMNMAYMYLRLGNVESAYLEFDQVTKKCPDCRSALLGAAISAQKLGRYPDALEDIKKILSQDESNPLANYLMGLHVRFFEKDKEKSKKWFEQVLDSPSSDLELNEKVRALLQNDDEDNAAS